VRFVAHQSSNQHPFLSNSESRIGESFMERRCL